MAIIGNTFLNLLDVAAVRDTAEGGIIEVLNSLEPFYADANVIKANKGSSHMVSMRTGLPAVTWGALYQGIPQSKSGYTSVEDTTGFLEGLDAIDTRLVDLEPENSAKLRAMESLGFMESFSQAIGSAIWYSNVAVSPKQFHGLFARYNTLANPNVIDGGGTGADNASIVFVTHGDAQTSIIVPKNVPAGLQTEDMGKQRVPDGNMNPYYVLERIFRQYIGLTVKDWRYNARVANIDVSDVAAGTVSLNKLMSKAYYALQGRRAFKMEKPGEASPGRTVIYMNRQMMQGLDAEATNANLNNALTLGRMELQGEEVRTWRGLPIRETDSLLNTETRVV
ncbi:major capsid protein [Novosphingobium sp. Leaf2]|uniref:major capsid protein n=1 Tax=Novosphingobium sp. Leaf2 TaxID=1735670 RepID=UPI0006FC8596|nr:hypothetical protein [Novosphingobium sp. Leaf2]KQM18386.1 hypothetical protein ASE49_09250 [Novosphingobium sp. Leaf2]